MATILTPDEIKQKIQDWITSLGGNEITGAHLNAILSAIMDYVGVGFAFMDSAPAEAPSSDVPVVYIAGPGTYTGYEDNAVEIPEGSMCIFMYDGSDWSKRVLEVSGHLIDNPEWLEVVTDSQDRILYGVKTDGKFYFGAGCPPQVIEYIQNIIDGLSLDEYEDIVTFLGDLIDGETLEQLLAKKADGEYIDNPEWLEVVTDSLNRVLEGIKKDGSKYFASDIYINGKITSKNGEGLSKNNFSDEDKEVVETQKILQDVEDRLDILTDVKGKILSYRDKKGVLHEEAGLVLSQKGLNAFQEELRKNGFRAGGAGDKTDYISNNGANPLYLAEPRLAFLNIISNFNLSNLNKRGYNQYSQKGVNYDLPTIVEYYDTNGIYFRKPTLMSAQGSSSMGYEKKNIAFDFFDTEVDGDALSIKFGDWIPCDSFHLKAFMVDFFKCLSPVCYKIAEKVAKTKDFMNDVQWKRGLWNDIDFTANIFTSAQIEDMSLRLDTGAKCQPDGFPVIVYQNGEFYGVYAWMIKKTRDNYHLNKNNENHIHIDGQFYTHHLFNGDLDWTTFEVRNPKGLYYKEAQTDVETGQSTYKYDADIAQAEIADAATVAQWIAAGELPDGTVITNKIRAALEMTATVHESIVRLSNSLSAIEEGATTEAKKALAEQYFDIDSLIDYELVQCAVADTDAIFNNCQWITYDGLKWFACEYDKDDTFGNHTWECDLRDTGGWSISAIRNADVANGSPIGLVRKYYSGEAKTRWQELVSEKIFASKNIIDMLNEWMLRVGVSNYEKEYVRWNSRANSPTNINTEYWEYRREVETSSAPTYNANTQYSANDICKISGGTGYIEFKCIAPCVGIPPVLDADFNNMGWRGSLGQLFNFIKSNLELENAFFETL